MKIKARNNKKYMEKTSDLLRTAWDLVQLLDKGADECLPNEIVDIVKLHAKLAVGSAWIPVPGADVAAGAVNIWSMYIRINSKVDMSFGESILKTIASGVATNLASYAAMMGVGSLIKLVPGIGTWTGALVMSATLYAITLASGYVYLKALTILLRQKKSKSITSKDLKDAIDVFLTNNKNEIKRFIKSAKDSYKENK